MCVLMAALQGMLREIFAYHFRKKKIKCLVDERNGETVENMSGIPD